MKNKLKKLYSIKHKYVYHLEIYNVKIGKIKGK